MNNFKEDFPIFQNNPWLVFLDNAASVQKPSHVIDGIKYFFEHDYANIHRGMYELSERSESLYEKSKEKVAEFIGAKEASEISYTYNSTYAINMLVLSLKRSWFFKKWDKILLSLSEHHANIVPWLIIKDEIGIELDYVKLDEDFLLDFDDFEKKLTPEVKIISLSAASNVTWATFDLEKVSKIIDSKLWENRKNIRFIVDASQAMPNFKADVQKINCDFLIFSGHKVMAETWIWVLYWKKELLKEMLPAFWWWWAINWVKTTEYSPSGLPFRFEPGTPNISWAVSLLKAFEYIESIGWYEIIQKIENELISYTLEKFKELEYKVKLVWSKKLENRVGVFSFYIPWIHQNDIADYMAEENVCIRAWHHCTQPFIESLGIPWSARMSLYFYNDKTDIDKFFDVLRKIIKELN